VKFKIGSLNWEDELNLLSSFRNAYPYIEIRVDANGAFKEDALLKLNQLSELNIHSIEQPIAKGNWKRMADLCLKSPIPIALDEELIGWNEELLRFLEDHGLPQYLILKPSLHGGIKKCDELSKWASSNQLRFWVTSYLESNIGLNHIANWVCSKGWNFRHGLGTGSLFERNFEESWRVENGFLIPVQV
jgi:L-alanine-DL-glutamate epimerase-like enolase superfamily enzyme